MVDVTIADGAKRMVAGALDGFIAIILFAVISLFAGSFIACLLTGFAILMRDAPVFHSLGISSPGKRFMGLEAVGFRDRSVDLAASITRNMTLASFFLISPVLVALFAILPLIAADRGYLVGALIALVLMAVEIYEILRDPRGQRLGDLLAGTKVIENAFEGLDNENWQAPGSEV